MREIKFRAWDGKKMTDKIELHFAHGLRLVSTSDLEFDKVGDDECVLMQYTGLLDKNGKEIYEGDTIRWGSRENYKQMADVVWVDETGFFPFNGMTINNTPIGEEVEVIGNIYENPELLK